MDELQTLKQYIEAERYEDALLLISEMAEMSKEDKLNKIFSFVMILLMHLMKEAAEQRSTRSWQNSIYLSTQEIQRTNKRRNSGGFYANKNELKEILQEAYEAALRRASLEAFEGQYSEQEFAQKIDKASIINKALELISPNEH
jgi:Domain of unknown function DUF29